MIAALTFLIGFQLLPSFLNYDISSSSRTAASVFGLRPAPEAREPAKAGTSEIENDGLNRPRQA
jgi:hypothetical protein